MGQAAPLITRRTALAGAAALVAGCQRLPAVEGGFTGASVERGHLLRAARPQGPVLSLRADVVVAGAGIAGLAAARHLRLRGREDFAVLDLEDTAGGNSRAGELRGIACPLGAHYLPVPGDGAPEVQDLLQELGLLRRVAGRWQPDERHLCHAPQERLYFEGEWQEGLLPWTGVGATTRAQYVRFAQEVEAARRTRRFAIPLRRREPLAALDGETFAHWLDARGFTDPQLRWYLDYCCRDDYGAGTSIVSAWAGVHYFAARHGFHPPGFDESGERDALLTWPEGNGFLSRALARPLGDRFRGGRVVLRIAETRHGVEVDAWDVAAQRLERWQAKQCVVALPAFVAARVVENAPPALRSLAARTRHAPWIVANLHLREPPWVRGGAPLAWDNVVYGAGDSLGYVVATHQSLDPAPGPTVLSWYCAPGEAARGDVLRLPWTHWRERVLAELSVPHPEFARTVTHVAVARYGHAMAIPVPGTLAALPQPRASGRLRFAHSDWAGYSIFEEAFTLGHRAAA
ncbi:FAD-dependent oxidoreductase [Ramlibacter sp. USB13]|uniref:FAD-dependent oxidoreductase n=1 Tax=Ramlibacter cellulosilyticus TaxID=2764187 RepID=A0A923MPV0_9BURK|nr:FAD-dependent oxidoreductase [Ramlibacter cellulosilyticus]MBC5782721.1 FAD-dependent oxidoreductase [Ramlibacter cellulosilyticus]